MYDIRKMEGDQHFELATSLRSSTDAHYDPYSEVTLAAEGSGIVLMKPWRTARSL